MSERRLDGEVLALSVSAEDPVTAQRELVRRAYEEHRDVIWRYLKSLGVEAEEAQDLTQDVFVRLYIAVRRGEKIATPRAWLFTVASNAALDRYRARARRTEAATEEAARLLLEHHRATARPDTNLLESERASGFRAAMQLLSPQQRACVHLRAEGLRYREIAEVLGVSVPAVSEFLRRAIRRLRSVVDG